jgi:NAD(P)-dependent dehydrogenase (short-subunit alcohol dehydrogenase family)
MTALPTIRERLRGGKSDDSDLAGRPRASRTLIGNGSMQAAKTETLTADNRPPKLTDLPDFFPGLQLVVAPFPPRVVPMPSSHPVALVTGSSRGIGRAIALQLAKDGHAIVVNYLRSRAAAEELAAEIEGLGSPALAVGGNVGEAADRERLVRATLDRFGRIDVLVNNAGITSQGRRDLLEAGEESWDVVFDTNLKGPFFLTQRVANQMIGLIDERTIDRGTIINISSVSAYAVSTNRGDYCMAKAALRMMTWLFAERLAEERIWVYEVCPGIIASDMTAPVQEKYDRLIAEGLTPIRRWGQPEDVAQAVSGLVSGKFAFSTGERINVDGGFHIRRL